MINTILIYNHNIIGVPNRLEVTFEGRKVTTVLVQRSLLGTVPHFFCAFVNGHVLFQEDVISQATGQHTVSRAEYEIRLERFLGRYIDAKRRNAKSKMELLRVYFASNDLGAAQDVLEHMKSCGSARMLSFILNNSGEDASHDHQDDRYSRFLDICREIDRHSAYIFALELLDAFSTRDLIQLYGDLKLIFPAPADGRVRVCGRQEEVLYGLEVLLHVRIATELASRGQFRAAGTVLIQMSEILNNTEDIQIVEEILSIAFGLLDSPQGLLDEMIGTWESGLHLTSAQVFYISSRFLIDPSAMNSDPSMAARNGLATMLQVACKQTQQCQSYTVSVQSYTDIFEFQAVKTQMKNVFTERVKVVVRDAHGAEPAIMGVLDSEGRFYIAERDIVSPPGDFTGGTVILSDGRQVVDSFRVRKLERKTDIRLIGIEEIERSRLGLELPGESRLKKLTFEFKNGEKCNYSFKDAVFRVEKENVELLFAHECSEIEAQVEISTGIYERRYYYV